MKSDADRLRLLLRGMRDAYARGENAMAYARSQLKHIGEKDVNETIATLIAYDLQAGSYIDNVHKDPEYYREWSRQLARIIDPLTSPESSILEVGCGEATTLAGLLQHRNVQTGPVLGFDISWSRVHEGYGWLAEMGVESKLFVGDLFSIPLVSDSIDVVYTSHSLEPNGGREKEAIAELLRVSRRWVVLVEPMYEMASLEARKRMKEHGYATGLRQAAEHCGAKVIQHRLLECTRNPLNPSGLLVLEKQSPSRNGKSIIEWSCPITGAPLIDAGDAFISEDTGLAYPVLRGIPLLRAEHAVVASALKAH